MRVVGKQEHLGEVKQTEVEVGLVNEPEQGSNSDL